MPDHPDIASVGAVIGDPSRARMLMALMDGRAMTATELALAAGVSPSTASGHLGRLDAAGMVRLVRQGRHRYFQLAGHERAALVEALMNVAPPDVRRGGGRRADQAIRHARVCYDHLAGECGVGLLDRLLDHNLIAARADALFLTPEGEAWADAFGIDVAALGRQRRPVCRPCLDWSERRMHLAGSLGAGILDRLFTLRYARRDPAGRALSFSPRGAAFLASPVT